MIETDMGTVPWWLGATAFLAAIGTITIILIPLIKREHRVLFKMGWRHSAASTGVSLGRALPVSLLVAVVLASLSVGDGLFQMVEENTDSNLSDVNYVLEAPGFAPEDLVNEKMKGIEEAAPIILLNGGASSENERSSDIRLMGFDERFLDLGNLELTNGDRIEGPLPSLSAYINRKAAEDLSLGEGDWILITVDPRDRSEDVLLGITDTGSIKLNLTVDGIVENKGLGRYREDALDEVLPTCFMDLQRLKERLAQDGVNRFLISVKDGVNEEEFAKEIEGGLTLEKAGFSRIPAADAGGSLIISDQFLFGSSLLDPQNISEQSLTYFVDSLRSGDDNLSYSVVSGIEDLSGNVGTNIGKNEAVINNWTAEHLGLEIGDTLTMKYRTVTTSGNLETFNSSVEVAAIVNISGLFAERNLIPPIEGITGEVSCTTWDPGFEVDLNSIEDEDLNYWDLYRTTPKVFINLEEAREMWSSRWGDTTALLIENEDQAEAIESGLGLDSLEVTLIPVRENALSSSRALSIFPGMFLTFGTAVMASTGLVLFAVTKELSLRRAGEWGILRSLGVSRFKVSLFGLYENFRPLIWGSFFGVLLGAFISYILNLTLSTIWSETVEGSDVPLSLTIPSVLVSVSAGIMISTLIVLGVVTREALKVPVSNTRGEEPGMSSGTRRWMPLASGVLFLIAGIVILASLIEGGGTFDVAGPFVLGSMLAGSGSALILVSILPSSLDLSDTTLLVTASLSRRPGQTRLGIAFLTLVLTVALSLSGMGSLLRSSLESEEEAYGGGFDILVETSFGTRPEDIDNLDLEAVSLLTYGKEGGTCSNINAVFPPRLVGMPERLRTSDGFELIDTKDDLDEEEIWEKLSEENSQTIPIVVDENTLRWIYFGDIGTIFELEPAPGRIVDLEVIGILGPSVLTGTFVMSEGNLKNLYPSASARDLILIKGDTTEENLLLIEEQLAGYGPEAASIEDLAEENLNYELSYLSLFRDFLVFGVLVAMGALVLFNHNRSLRFRKEMVVHRSLGVKKRKAGIYLMSENAVVLIIALMGAVSGSIISVALTGTLISDDPGLTEPLLGMVPVLIILILISGISSTASAWYSVKDYEDQVPRGIA